MTDRYSAFLVILDRDIRDDDAQSTIDAIKHIKGVLDVQPYIGVPDVSIAEMRVKTELRAKLLKVLWEE